MNIEEIENSTFAKLKAKRAELVEAAKGLPPEQLAARYVQARTDAKARDEKLADQGKTIIALQDGLAAAKDQAVVLGEKLDEQTRIIENLRDDVRIGQTKYHQVYQELQGQTNRAERLKLVARKTHRAVAQAARLLNDALADNAVDEADKGEP